jgi:hypothetical protein
MNILTTTERLKVIQRRLGSDKEARIIANRTLLAETRNKKISNIVENSEKFAGIVLNRWISFCKWLRNTGACFPGVLDREIIGKNR